MSSPVQMVSLLKKNRKLEVNSFVLRDRGGQPITLTGPHIKVEELVPLIPRTAYRRREGGREILLVFYSQPENSRIGTRA